MTWQSEVEKYSNRGLERLKLSWGNGIDTPPTFVWPKRELLIFLMVLSTSRRMLWPSLMSATRRLLRIELLNIAQKITRSNGWKLKTNSEGGFSTWEVLEVFKWRLGVFLQACSNTTRSYGLNAGILRWNSMVCVIQVVWLDDRNSPPAPPP